MSGKLKIAHIDVKTLNTIYINNKRMTYPRIFLGQCIYIKRMFIHF